MKTYPDAVNFHADLLVEPIWYEHFAATLSALMMLHRHDQITMNRLVNETMRAFVQANRAGEVKQVERLLIRGDTPLVSGKTATYLARGALEAVRSTNTVWVDPDVIAACDTNEQQTLPEFHRLPFPEGATMLFGEPFRTRTPNGKEALDILGAVWWPVRVGDMDKAVLFSIAEVNGKPTVDLSSLWSLGEPMDESRAGVLKPLDIKSPSTPADIDGANDLDMTFDAAEAFSGERLEEDRRRYTGGSDQSNLIAYLLHHLAYGDDDDVADTKIAVTDASHSKSAKRSAKKRGIDPEVNVIYLNRNKRKVFSEGGTSRGGSPRRHRVRAHWRRQPYGPKRSLRRWVLVEAHERGRGTTDERPKVYVESQS